MSSSAHGPVHLRASFWPPMWQARTAHAKKVIAGVLTFFMPCLAIGVVAAFGHDPVGMLMLSGSAAFIAATLWIYLVHLASRRRSADCANLITLDAKTCVLIPMSRACKTSYLALSVVGVLMTATWPMIAWVVPHERMYGEVRLRLLALVAPILGLYFVGVLCSRIVRKRKEMGLGLCPEGIYYWTWFGCCFFDWNWISEIQLTSRTGPGVRLQVHEPLQHPADPEENWVARIDRFRNKKTRLQLGFLAVNPAIALHAIVFYFQHPDKRAELSTNAAIARIRQGDLLD